MARERSRVGAALRAAWMSSVFALALLPLSRTAAACPNCAEGVLARRAVLQEDFGRNFVYAALPFLIIGAVCAGAERLGRRRPVADAVGRAGLLQIEAHRNPNPEREV
jgi:hypothetical protein